jgi:hypothetical protein
MAAAAVPASAAPTAGGATPPAGGPAAHGPVKDRAGKPAKLGAEDQQLVTEAANAGKRSVTVMVIAANGQTAQAKADIRALGGSIRYAADTYSYFSAHVPVQRVDKAAASKNVRAISVDRVVAMPDPGEAGRRGPAAASKGPDAKTPDDNPFMPTNETGAVAFKKAHPAWDGAGVTIGILDTGVDLSHPALQKTTKRERKIVDWFTATDPVSEGSLAGEDATWLPMLQDASGPVFPATGTYRGARWKLPRGSYKIRTFDEAGTDVPGCEVCGDVNRDGDTTDRIGVLYDPVSHDIRVDSDDDKNFKNNHPMRPYNEKFQVGTFGKDKKNTAVVDSMAFTVDYREDQDIVTVFGPDTGLPDKIDFVDIGIVSGEHGSHVAGITAANNMFGGQMDGAAPGAKLVSARACQFGPGCTEAALTDGMAELAANRGVDIINMSIGGLPALNDGNNPRVILYNKIIAAGVQIVLSAGNEGNALNTIGDPAVASDAVAAGASISDKTWKANYGSTVAFKGKRMMTFSSGGPAEDGGLKPNITAPGSAISTIPTWLPGNPVPEAGYPLPTGYAMLNGTSMAAPQTTGAMALLISAAKATGADSAPAKLRSSVYSTATYNKDVPAFLQGYGEVNVTKAWDLLKANPTPTGFSSSAPVCTEIWQIFGVTSGKGVYNRCAADEGGHAPGQAKTYPVKITRAAGSGPVGHYAVSLQGNDGTFSVDRASVDIAPGESATVNLTAKPASGARSVLLRLDDPATKNLDYAVMNVVAVGSELTAPSYSKSESGSVNRNEPVRYYVTVPAGTKALQVDLSGLAAGSQTRFLAFHPYGVPMETGSSLVCYSNFSDEDECNPHSRAYANPEPGVWEILVESRRTSPLLTNPYTLTASLLGATLTPELTTLDSVAKGEPTDLSWSAHNDFGTVTAVASGGPLGSAKSARDTIANHDVKEYTVEVPEGASRLDVSIGNTSDLGADLDLYVVDPSGEERYDADGDSEESLTYIDPAPGTYTVTVDGFDVPNSTGVTEFDYLDVFFADSLGSLDVDETPFTFTGGATKEIDGILTANAVPESGRELFGQLSLESASGAVLGTASVLVKSVT